MVEAGVESLTLCKHLHARPLACLPEPKNALLGALPLDHPNYDEYAAEAARTIPGRENGGNCDIKNLTVSFFCVALINLRTLKTPIPVCLCFRIKKKVQTFFPARKVPSFSNTQRAMIFICVLAERMQDLLPCVCGGC